MITQDMPIETIRHNVAKMVRYMGQHGCQAYYDESIDFIIALTHYTYRDDEGNVQSGSCWETVTPTWKFVRKYLGY